MGNVNGAAFGIAWGFFAGTFVGTWALDRAGLFDDTLKKLLKSAHDSFTLLADSRRKSSMKLRVSLHRESLTADALKLDIEGALTDKEYEEETKKREEENKKVLENTNKDTCCNPDRVADREFKDTPRIYQNILDGKCFAGCTDILFPGGLFFSGWCFLPRLKFAPGNLEDYLLYMTNIDPILAQFASTKGTGYSRSARRLTFYCVGALSFFGEHTHTHTYTRTKTYTHIHTHTHTHTQYSLHWRNC